MSTKIGVAIIGSGPAGWTAAIYLARAGLAPVVFTGDQAGGQLMLTTVVENFPGFPSGVEGSTLMEDMKKQAVSFGTTVLAKRVTDVDFSNEGKLLWVGEEQYEAKAVLIATGATTVWLGISGEKELIGRGVSSCAVCDAAFFRDKKTVVIGGGDAAMEDVLALTKFASSVTIIHRRDAFRASKIMQERVLAHPKVQVLWDSVPLSFQGNGKLEKVMVQNIKTKEQKELLVDGAFVAIGHMPNTKLFANHIALDEKGFVQTGKHTPSYPTMTSATGVFAAGDCVDFRYKQAITSAGMGCMASLDLQWWLEA